MEREKYSDRFLDHCNDPRNVGAWPIDDPMVGTGRAEAQGCRDTVKLQLRVEPSSGRITARFKAFGCSGTIAIASLATERLRDLTLAEAITGLDELGRDLGRDLALPANKRHCEMLIEDAIRAAIRHYQDRAS